MVDCVMVEQPSSSPTLRLPSCEVNSKSAIQHGKANSQQTSKCTAVGTVNLLPSGFGGPDVSFMTPSHPRTPH